MMKPLIILLFSNSIILSLSIYTNEPPVKLLEVESLADRYPATESEYRTSVTNGFVRKKENIFHKNINIQRFM